ncbi:MAG TPA: hypothetical protein VFI31_09050 [Pirellulales bacterium]|nr:hypothetical protein [Pirellulales bacterium]
MQQSETTVAEIQRLFEVVDRDLADARVKGLSADGRFQHAYDAALQLCMIPLRASGYTVPKGQGHHKRAIDSLRYTLGSSFAETADYIERCSRLRSQSIYERTGVISKDEAAELVKTSGHLRDEVVAWLKANYAVLVPPNLQA